MKKLFTALASVFAGASVFAADGDSIIDGATVTTTLTTMKNDLSTWATGVMPVVAGIVGVFILFWLLRFGIRLIKSFSSSAK